MEKCKAPLACNNLGASSVIAWPWSIIVSAITFLFLFIYLIWECLARNCCCCCPCEFCRPKKRSPSTPQGRNLDTNYPVNPAATKGPNIRFKNLTLLNDDGEPRFPRVSGHFRGGKMTAILGPSGCGKSSLLSIIAGNYTGTLGGKIWLGDKEPVKPTQIDSTTVGFVPQHEIMHRDQTVKETLTFYKRLRSTQCNVDVRTSPFSFCWTLNSRN